MQYELIAAKRARVDYETARDAYLVAPEGKELTRATGVYRNAQVVYRMACIEFFEAFEREHENE